MFVYIRLTSLHIHSQTYTHALKTREIKIIFLFRYKRAHNHLKIPHHTMARFAYIYKSWL